MKTERRHELQTNQLADMLGQEIQVMGPYWKLIVGGLVAAVAVAIVWMSVASSQKTARERVWKPLLTAQSKAVFNSDNSELLKAADEAGDSPAALFALQMNADRELSEGVRLLFVNRKEADEHLEKAVESYGKVEKRSTHPEFKLRALLGLGSAYESLRNVERAQEAYEAAIKEGTKNGVPGVIAGEAEKRLGRLKENKEWYAWFKDQSPPVPHGLPGKPGEGGFNPGAGLNLDSLPGNADIKLSNPPPVAPPPSAPPSDPAAKTDEAPKTEGAPKTDEAPKTEDAPKTDDAPKADPAAPATTPAPEPPAAKPAEPASPPPDGAAPKP